VFNYKALRNLIEAKGLKQSEFARMTEIPRNTISKYVKGKSKPSAERVKLLAEILGVTFETLMLIDESETPVTPKRHLCFCPNCGVDLGGIAE